MSVPSILFLAPTFIVTPLFQPLKRAGLDVGLAETIPGALKFIQLQQPLLVFCRDRLTGFKAEDLLSAMQRSGVPMPPVIVFTENGSAEQARKFMELGAHDYWLEPLSWEKVRALLTAPADVSQKGSRPEVRPGTREDAHAAELRIIGEHQTIKKSMALAKQVARSKATILISGESGTGKEMFARYLHNASDRSAQPFIAVNCAALPEHLLESELFGHEKGAFTGAITRKLGKFELANNGTILLDEISEMDLGLQAKLLRVLQEGELDRVGGSETVPVDVRVLATTNRDLAKSVEAKQFRQDLYYRLNVIPLRLPALRERGNDVLLLADYFVSRFALMYSLGTISMSEEARKWLLAHDWPGNVRELQNLMERAALLCAGSPIELRHFLLDESGDWQDEAAKAPVHDGQGAAEAVLEAAPETAPEAAPEAVPETAIEERSSEGAPGTASAPKAAASQASSAIPGGEEEILPLHEVERHLIFRGLNHTAGNRTQAAVLLGISVRTLRNKLNEYRKMGLEVP